MQSRAATVADYLASLPEDRLRAVEAVRGVILENLDSDYAEGMSYGMIGYNVPHRVYPSGYHADPRQPLPFAALASQKGHFSLYLMSLYCGSDEPAPAEYARWFHEACAKAGKKLDLGKACIRFKRLEDLPLAVIGEAVRRVPAKTYVAWYESGIGKGKAAGGQKKAAAGQKKAAGAEGKKAAGAEGKKAAGAEGKKAAGAEGKKAAGAKAAGAKAAGAKAAGAKAAGAKAAGAKPVKTR